jgi:diguanylate cyclase (GGDEF)-like protein
LSQAPFLAQLEALLERRRADARMLAVLMVDCGLVGRIDGAWGYAAGDAAHAHLGARLRSGVLRAQDLLGETGRDRFACVLEAVQSPGVALLAAEKILRALDEPVWAGDVEVFARPAVGIAIFPEHGEDAAQLLQRARSAARAARDRPERITIYDGSQDPQEAEQLAAESRLRVALAEDALEPVFAARRELRTGLVVAAECLLRWRDGSEGLVRVEDAMAVAESSGRVNEAIAWLLNAALRSCREIRDSGGLDLRIGINLSAKGLRQRDVRDFVASALQTWNLRPSRLVLEITQTGILTMSEKARETLEALKALGVRLLIDDPAFGSVAGAHLATLPFHEVKIDLGALGGGLADEPRQALARSLTGFAHDLRLEVLAAGVTDEAAADWLKALGCDCIQGAHVGPPLDVAGFLAAYGS